MGRVGFGTGIRSGSRIGPGIVTGTASGNENGAKFVPIPEEKWGRQGEEKGERDGGREEVPACTICSHSSQCILRISYRKNAPLYLIRYG